ncbi:hypothetical protein [Zhongshania sp.]|uniref:gp33 family protein n=1 Tax=Zhongshania sp. TaxID=1971902 RepID=UPI003569B47D
MLTEITLTIQTHLLTGQPVPEDFYGRVDEFVTGEGKPSITSDLAGADTDVRKLMLCFEAATKAMSYADLAQHYRQFQSIRDRAKAVTTALTAAEDIITKKVVPERLDEDGMSNVTIKGVGRWQVQGDMYVSTPKDKKEALFDWLEDNGHGSLITDTVNASTLKAFVKEQMKLGNEIPDDILRIEPYDRASLVKA